MLLIYRHPQTLADVVSPADPLRRPLSRPLPRLWASLRFVSRCRCKSRPIPPHHRNACRCRVLATGSPLLLESARPVIVRTLCFKCNETADRQSTSHVVVRMHCREPAATTQHRVQSTKVQRMHITKQEKRCPRKLQSCNSFCIPLSLRLVKQANILCVQT